jgi:hypothetical protein
MAGKGRSSRTKHTNVSPLTTLVRLGRKLYGDIPLLKAATLARLPAGHRSLNQFLHRFGLEETPECSCGSRSIESVKHYLLVCKEYKQERDELRNEVGEMEMKVEKLDAPNISNIC